tara:strand:- start:415 stop:690 length:276 start_codon:yes stop_codon:yes gene_type:complete
MDLYKLKATNRVLMKYKEKFQIGDLVSYQPKDFGYNYVPPKVLGMVVPNDPLMENLALFPQISVLVFDSGRTQLFWPSYLQVISAAGTKKT